MALTPPTDAYAPIYMIPAMFAIYGGLVASLLLGAVAVGLAVVARSDATDLVQRETEDLAAAPAASSASIVMPGAVIQSRSLESDSAMTEPPTEQTVSTVSSRNGRIAFVLGGGLFVASAILNVALTPTSGSDYPPPVSVDLSVTDLVHLAAAVLFGAGVVVFAWGIRGKGSVVARRPLGLTALTLFAVSIPLVDAIGLLFRVAYPDDPLAAAAWGVNLVSILVMPAAGVTGAMRIALVGAVPGGWRWLPVIAVSFGIAVALWGVMAAFSSAEPAMTDSIRAVVGLLTAWYPVVSPLVLGVVAIWLASAARRPAAG